MASRTGPAFFSREAFPIFQAAFRQLEKSPPFDVARFFVELSVRALVVCGRFEESLSLVGNERPDSLLAEDERIAQFVRMLDRAEASAAAERAGQIQLRHLLRASFEELAVTSPALVNASSVARATSVAATCLQLRDRAFERRDVIHRVEVRYHVLSAGANVVDHGNEYATLPDAVRAMHHLQQRAGLRAAGEASEHVTYVMILLPGNAEAVSQLAIRAEAVS